MCCGDLCTIQWANLSLASLGLIYIFFDSVNSLIKLSNQELKAFLILLNQASPCQLPTCGSGNTLGYCQTSFSSTTQHAQASTPWPDCSRHSLISPCSLWWPRRDLHLALLKPELICKAGKSTWSSSVRSQGYGQTPSQSESVQQMTLSTENSFPLGSLP